MELNQAQKFCVAAGVAMTVLTVFLHNPISGYYIEIKQMAVGPRPCTEAEKSEVRENYTWAEKNLKPSGYTPEQIEQKAQECTSFDYPPAYLPFDLWRSNEALVPWLGYVTHLLFALACIAAIATSTAFIFRSAPIEK